MITANELLWRNGNTVGRMDWEKIPTSIQNQLWTAYKEFISKTKDLIDLDAVGWNVSDNWHDTILSETGKDIYCLSDLEDKKLETKYEKLIRQDWADYHTGEMDNTYAGWETLKEWWENEKFVIGTDYYGSYTQFIQIDQNGSLPLSIFNGGSKYYRFSCNHKFFTDNYFVVNGKVTDSNAREILDKFLESKADKIHFVDYASAGAKTAWNKIMKYYLYESKYSYSCSHYAGKCTVEALKEYYDENCVIGVYDSSEQVKHKQSGTKRNKKTPSIKVINFELLQKLSECNATWNGWRIIKTESESCVRIISPKRLKYQLDNEKQSADFTWSDSQKAFMCGNTNERLKTPLANAIVHLAESITA